MIPRNKMAVIDNPYQGKYKKVLTVCSGGVLRSPTAATLLSRDPYNFNTRSCGTEDYALIPLTEELLRWADIIVCAEDEHIDVVMTQIRAIIKEGMMEFTMPQIYVLEIPDMYDYMNPELVKLMEDQFKELFPCTPQIVG